MADTNIILTILCILLAISSLISTVKNRNLRRTLDCLEKANMILRECLDDSVVIITKQKAELSVEQEEKPVVTITLKLFKCRRNDNAPELGLSDIKEVIVVAGSKEEAKNMLRDIVKDDGWWELVDISQPGIQNITYTGDLL